jgi:hypothetical protein
MFGENCVEISEFDDSQTAFRFALYEQPLGVRSELQVKNRL